MTERIARLRRILDDRGLDAALVSLPANRFYLSGFPDDDDGPDESSGVVVLDATTVTLWTSKTNAPWAAATVHPGVAVAAWERPWESKLGARIRAAGYRAVGFEDQALTVASHAALLEAAGTGVRLEPLGVAISALRAVKEPAELDLIEAAIRLTDEVFVAATAGLTAGTTER